MSEDDEERDFQFVGEARVSVSLTVRAKSLKEATAIAEESMDQHWECDEVDGYVKILEVDGEPYTRKRRSLKSTSTFRIPPSKQGA